MTIPANRLHRPTPGFLQRVSIVLVSPSHPGNVGACARAMRVMGLRNLSLVAPRREGVTLHADARAFASGATGVLDAALQFDTLVDALAACTLSIAVSADAREYGPALQAPEPICAEVVGLLRHDPRARIAFVFGPERTGLSIEDASHCQRLCSIPGDPAYHSLNLAQAVQVISYVLRQHADAAPGDLAAAEASEASVTLIPSADSMTLAIRTSARQGGQIDPGRAAVVRGAAPPLAATGAEIEGFLRHFEQSLITIGYLDPSMPKKLMPRMRRLFARAGLEQEEVNLLRGVCKMIQQHAGRPPDKISEG